MDAEGTRAAPVPAAIEHLGYEGDQMHKHRRNLPLLEREVVEDPDRTYLWYHLGVVRLALDDPTGAEDAWTHAIATCDERDDLSNPGLLSYVELALHRLRTGRSAADLVDALARRRNDDPLTSWVKAGQAMHEARWTDAIALLEPLLAIDTEGVLNQELAYNRQIFDARALNALGVCWFQLGEDATAAELFARAEASDPSTPEYRVKRELAEARAARR
jgi:tetratricopeptide (TPR) repeat protein